MTSKRCRPLSNSRWTFRAVTSQHGTCRRNADADNSATAGLGRPCCEDDITKPQNIRVPSPSAKSCQTRTAREQTRHLRTNCSETLGCHRISKSRGRASVTGCIPNWITCAAGHDGCKHGCTSTHNAFRIHMGRRQVHARIHYVEALLLALQALVRRP